MRGGRNSFQFFPSCLELEQTYRILADKRKLSILSQLPPVEGRRARRTAVKTLSILSQLPQCEDDVEEAGERWVAFNSFPVASHEVPEQGRLRGEERFQFFPSCLLGRYLSIRLTSR